MVTNQKAGGSFDCSDHEMVELRILKEENKAKSSIITLDFRRADFGLFRNLLGRIIWDTVPEWRGPGQMVNFQRSPHLRSRTAHLHVQEFRQRWQEV